MLNYSIKGLILISLLLIVSCSERAGLAPVEEVNWKAANNGETRHIVARGETLFAIAFRYDQDFRQLAQLNHLQYPYTLRVGQVINLRKTAPVTYSTYGRRSQYSHASQYTQVPRNHSHSYSPTRVQTTPPSRGGTWIWPAHGRVVANFAPQLGKKGIDISGRQGSKIVAAASGVVAYAGSGLTGYGNLIIIKHENHYLTAYGHNLRNLVREGQRIKAGQIIAEMGMIERKFWGLHFEIRKGGQPVNPLNYLQKG